MESFILVGVWRPERGEGFPAHKYIYKYNSLQELSWRSCTGYLHKAGLQDYGKECRGLPLKYPLRFNSKEHNRISYHTL